MARLPSASRIDTIYRNVLLSKFFVKGWGDPENMKRLFNFRKIISDRDKCNELVKSDHPVYIDRKVEENEHYELFEGHFLSPLVDYLPNMIPHESHTARFQLIIPRLWRNLDNSAMRPLCLQLAGTGDHNFWRRRNFMAKPLIKEYGIGSIILENPFYGVRKPANQVRSSLNNVSDIFIMGGCLILESLALCHWAERMGYGPLCVTGISMGGHMASLAATNWQKPISVVPCLSWTTASCVFTQGVMSGSIPWEILESQYRMYHPNDREELKQLIVSPEDNGNSTNELFTAGKSFARGFEENLYNFLQSINMTFPSYLKRIFQSESETNNIKNDNKNIQNAVPNSNTSPIANASGQQAIQPNVSVKAKQHEDKIIMKRDTFDFMRGIMDECTHLANFSTPVDCELAIIINAKHDAYVPSIGVMPLTDIWPGSSVRYLNRGHVSAILLDNNEFRKAIADSLDLNSSKHYGSSLYKQIRMTLKNNSVQHQMDESF